MPTACPIRVPHPEHARRGAAGLVGQPRRAAGNSAIRFFSAMTLWTASCTAAWMMSLTASTRSRRPICARCRRRDVRLFWWSAERVDVHALAFSGRGSPSTASSAATTEPCPLCGAGSPKGACQVITPSLTEGCARAAASGSSEAADGAPSSAARMLRGPRRPGFCPPSASTPGGSRSGWRGCRRSAPPDPVSARPPASGRHRTPCRLVEIVLGRRRGRARSPARGTPGAPNTGSGCARGVTVRHWALISWPTGTSSDLVTKRGDAGKPNLARHIGTESCRRLRAWRRGAGPTRAAPPTSPPPQTPAHD